MNEIEQDIYWMNQALLLAKQAGDLGEVPVGAVIIYQNQIISSGYNRREMDCNGIAHGELLAIEQACRQLHAWRLEHCTLYVTLEPCPMCAGAIINSRIPRVVFGAKDQKAGCFGSMAEFDKMKFNHTPEIVSGVLEEECSQILKDFFKKLRQK